MVGSNRVFKKSRNTRRCGCIKITKIISLIDLFGKNFSIFASNEVLENSLNIGKTKLQKIVKRNKYYANFI